MPPNWNKNSKSFICVFFNVLAFQSVQKKIPKAIETWQKMFYSFLFPAAAPPAGCCSSNCSDLHHSLCSDPVAVTWLIPYNQPWENCLCLYISGDDKAAPQPPFWLLVCLWWFFFVLTAGSLINYYAKNKRKKKKHIEEQTEEELGALVDVWETEGGK